MTGREKFIRALRRKPIVGHVPHFEMVFYLTMEVLGKVHPEHRRVSPPTWTQMSAREREAQLRDEASVYIDIAQKYHHSAIFVHPAVRGVPDAVARLLEIIRERSGGEYFLMMHGDTTLSIPDGENMMAFTVQIYEEPEKLRDQSKRNVDDMLESAQRLAGTGLLDGFAMCADYCYNTNPFFTNDMFADLVAPYLKQTIDAYREMGYYSIKHSDGNIMPLMDQIAECGPDALHSLDPQGGVDLKAMKRMYGDKMCMIGNVNCGLLQTGTEDEVRTDVLRSLRDGMPGYGYIFSTSNCVYTGLPLERYELMHGLWRDHGIY